MYELHVFALIAMQKLLYSYYFNYRMLLYIFIEFEIAILFYFIFVFSVTKLRCYRQCHIGVF